MATKKSRKVMPVILKCKDSHTRIVMRKNNPTKNKAKLSFKKYCPILRKHVLFTEIGRERYN